VEQEEGKRGGFKRWRMEMDSIVDGKEFDKKK
jgi:hypothetical protein